MNFCYLHLKFMDLCIVFSQTCAIAQSDCPIIFLHRRLAFRGTHFPVYRVNFPEILLSLHPNGITSSLKMPI